MFSKSVVGLSESHRAGCLNYVHVVFTASEKLSPVQERTVNENAGTPQDVHVLALEQLAKSCKLLKDKSGGPKTSADTSFLVIVEHAGELEQVAVW